MLECKRVSQWLMDDDIYEMTVKLKWNVTATFIAHFPAQIKETQKLQINRFCKPNSNLQKNTSFDFPNTVKQVTI